MFKFKRTRAKLEWQEAKDVKKDIRKILQTLDLPHIKSSRIFCFRTNGSKSRSYARIWAYPRIFQIALSIEPAYIIEVLSKYFDRLNKDEQEKVLIHELLHIPKNFSGALVSHRGRNRKLTDHLDKLFREYQLKSKFKI